MVKYDEGEFIMVKSGINQFTYSFLQVDKYGCFNYCCLLEVNYKGRIILFAPGSPMRSFSSIKKK